MLDKKQPAQETTKSYNKNDNNDKNNKYDKYVNMFVHRVTNGAD